MYLSSLPLISTTYVFFLSPSTVASKLDVFVTECKTFSVITTAEGSALYADVMRVANMLESELQLKVRSLLE